MILSGYYKTDYLNEALENFFLLQELSHFDTFDKKTTLYIRDFIEKNDLLFEIKLLEESFKTGGL